MKKLLYLAISLLAAVPALMAWVVPNESIHYGLRYKWGFIDANAGIAKLTTFNIPGTNKFQATLSGQSVNLMGHYYAAGDTMVGIMMADTIRPVFTQHILNETGDFVVETATYNAHPDSTANGVVVRKLPNGKVLRSRMSHYGGGLTLDLLGVYYYVRQVDYEKMHPGDTLVVNVATREGTEKLTLTYQGRSSAMKGSKEVPAFNVSLLFAEEKKPSKAESLQVYISDDSLRIPLLVNMDLSFGHVECTFLDADSLNLPLDTVSKLRNEYAIHPLVPDSVIQGSTPDKAPAASAPAATGARKGRARR